MVSRTFLSTVQSISLEEGAPELPGFFLGQAESSPALTLVFEDTKTAEECANAMKRIVARVLAEENGNARESEDRKMPTPGKEAHCISSTLEPACVPILALAH
jgi:hypothetical protein